MRTIGKAAVSGLLMLAVAACDDASGPERDDAFIMDAALLGAAAGQASMPGALMDGSGDPTRTSPCTFVAASGRFECAPESREGITITRSFALYDKAGNVQDKRGDATDAMNTRISASGTRTHTSGEMTVQRSSDMTVTGLAAGSTARTFNGSESGTVSGTRTGTRGTMTSTESFEAATSNVVKSTDRVAHPYPLSGTISRSATTTTSVDGGQARTRTWSEVITFNGTNRVQVVITHNGVTRTCTRDIAPRSPGSLPGDRMVCS